MYEMYVPPRAPRATIRSDPRSPATPAIRTVTQFVLAMALQCVRSATAQTDGLACRDP